MKTIMLFVLFFLLLTSSPSWATPEDAQTFFKARLDAVLLVLHETDLDNQAKKDRVMQILLPVFDLRLMAKLSVGKKHWISFSATQKQRFIDVFNKRLQESYLDSIMKFIDKEVVYQPPSLKRNKVLLPVEVISEGNSYGMVYKLYKSKDTWKIYDVEIEGVSILKSYRVQINEILGKETFEKLIRQFEKL